MESKLQLRQFVSNTRLAILQLQHVTVTSLLHSKSANSRISSTSTSLIGQQNYSSLNQSCRNVANNDRIARREISHQELMMKRRLRRVLVDNHLITNSEKGVQRKQIKKIVSHILTADNEVQDYIRKKSGRPIVSCLMYKSYLRLLGKDLIKHELPVPGSENPQKLCSDRLDDVIENMDVTSSAPRGLVPDRDNSWDTGLECRHEHCRQHRAQDGVSDGVSNLKQKMHDKYKDPLDEKVIMLKRLFPDPVKLFYDVMQPVHDAGLHCYEPVELSSHLDGFYWKAKIQLLWPRKVAMIGKHTDKQDALLRVYLAACEQLMNLGMIAHLRSSSHPRPIHCDSIMSILQQISEYGDTTTVDSRGKGFKIVLENINKRKQFPNSLSRGQLELQSYNKINGKICCEWRMKEENLTTTTTTCIIDDDITDNDAEDDDVVICNGPQRSAWSCSVHVGWPVPFSVRTVALSLPSAQMTALLTAASNLKMFGLLGSTNNGPDVSALQRAVMRDVARQWNGCIHSATSPTTTTTTTTTHHSGIHSLDWAEAGARIFVDASNVGYGAYLEMEDSNKVSWLCESWSDQPQQVVSQVYRRWGHRLYLHSSLAELHALASAIFSWKRKLQHRTVLCYSDNQIAITLMSTVNKFTKPLPPPPSPLPPYTTTTTSTSPSPSCISDYGCLVDIVQETCHAYNIHLRPSWIQRNRNCLADSLARWDTHTFKAAVPNAAPTKTKVKNLPWRNSSLSVPVSSS